MPELPGLEMPPEQDHWLTKEVDSKEKESRFCSGLTRPDTQFKPLILIKYGHGGYGKIPKNNAAMARDSPRLLAHYRVLSVS